MRLVGIISAHWETVDVFLQQAIAFVSDHELGRVALLTENIGFRTKIDLLMTYARPLQSEDAQLWKEFTACFGEIKKAYSLRNAFVHARWYMSEGRELPSRSVFRINGGKLVATNNETTLEELEKAADDILNAGESFYALLIRMGMPEPLIDKP